MRLINTRTFKLKDFGPRPPPYAILSHTWGEDEVTFQDISDLPAARKKKGFAKIERCCQQALRDGFDWAWVDTCCIDKTSSAELSETINSMYKWYERAMKCYAFLEDVLLRLDDVELQRPDGFGNQSSLNAARRAFFRSRWWKRGWTLQELIAPLDVEFYNCYWERLTSKRACTGFINSSTGIALSVLDHSAPLRSICAAERISWASRRITTREEDMAYCLLGILDVNMPLLYGEGRSRAFQRLQEQFIAANEDYTLFLWGFGPPVSGPLHDVSPSSHQLPQPAKTPAAITTPVLGGILADSPGNFGYEKAWSHWLLPRPDTLGLGAPPEITSRGLRLSLFIRKVTLEDFNGPSQLARDLRASSVWTNAVRWLRPGAASLLSLGAFPTCSTAADRLLPCFLLFDMRGLGDLDRRPEPNIPVTDGRSVATYARVMEFFFSVPLTEVVANLGWDSETCYLTSKIKPETRWHGRRLGPLPRLPRRPPNKIWIWRTPGPLPQNQVHWYNGTMQETRHCAYLAASETFPGCLIFVAARRGRFCISHLAGPLEREDAAKEAEVLTKMDLSTMWVPTAREAGPIGEHRLDFETGSLLVTLFSEQPDRYKVFLSLGERDS